MALIICVDGLGGHPETTFADLARFLEVNRHHVTFADIEGIRTHEDRIQSVIQAFRNGQSMLDEMNEDDRRIILIGHSAGGSAVRVAAARLRDEASLSGVVLLSQAMPRFTWYMTEALAKAMFWRSIDLLFARDIDMTSEEYTSLIQPAVSAKLRKSVDARQTIPGPEARTLAFWAPRLERYDKPTLVIYGERDQWISTNAHRKLCFKIARKCTSHLESNEIPGAGHIILASDSSVQVIEMIKRWINNLA